MRVTFFVPPAFSRKKVPERVFGCTYSQHPFPNIFILQAVSVLQRDNIEAQFIDAPVMGWSVAEAVEFLRKDSSQAVCFYTVNLAKEIDIYFAKEVRRLHPAKTIVFFGPAPTFYTQEFLIDEKTLVVRGEPEETFGELGRRVREGEDFYSVRGISYLREGSIVHNEARPLIEHLDSLPFPARHIMKERLRYYNPKLSRRPFTVAFTARGCPYRCRFCVPCSLNFARELEYKKIAGCKPPVRMRSAENVAEELSLLKAQGYKAISFLDDQFIWDPLRLEKIGSALLKGGFSWGCLARPDRISEDTAKILAETKCMYVDIGMESFQQEILDDIHKDMKVDSCMTAVSLLKKYKVNFKLNMLLGASPLETRESIQNTLLALKKIKPYAVMFSICNPFPGTEFWEVAKNHKWLVSEQYNPVDVQKESTISYHHLSQGELERLAKWLNVRFYCSFRFLFAALGNALRNPREILYNIAALLRKLF